MGKERRRSRSRSREKSPRRGRDRKWDSPDSDHSHSSGAQLEPKWKTEETKTLKIEACRDTEAAERTLMEISIQATTSVPDQIEVKEDGILVKYPTVEVSSAIMAFLNEKIRIGSREYSINYFPLRKINLNANYDWYCDKCDYKNFSWRDKCYHCETPRSEHCKVNYNSQSKPSKNSDDNINAYSLMVRGPIIMEIDEQELLDLFEEYGSIKDIRLIKNRINDQRKDFAFIEFFSAEEAAVAYKNTANSDFKVRGQKVSVMYSRNKSDDDYAKPLPYERRDKKKERKEKRSEGPVENYYNRQRQLEIEQEKQRPLITLEQLKEKHEQEKKRNATAPRELTEEQSKRRQAELMAKQWEREARMQQSVMYVCVVCRRKFAGEEEMRVHEARSELHRWNRERYQLSL